jgi:hypothetical protein
VWANRIVVTAPALDDDLGLAQRVEDLTVEQLVAQAGVEAFDEAVLLRFAGRDVVGSDSHEFGVSKPFEIFEHRDHLRRHVLAHNLKRMITIFGVGPLMAAIRT